MRVVDKRVTKPVGFTFGAICAGDCFMQDNRLFQKIRMISGEMAAVRLYDGQYFTGSDFDAVIPVAAECVIVDINACL